MAIGTTTTQMEHLLTQIASDLKKAINGNKAASQRVRTGTVKFEKIAKLFRKESVKADKLNHGKRKSTKKTTAKKTTKSTSTGSKKTGTKTAKKTKRSTTKKTATKSTGTKKKATARKSSTKRKTIRASA